jgi:hypothetical protein
MTYTLWSRGRLLGETDLGFIYREHGHRCGWFHPNELGDRMMTAATGVAPAMRTAFMIGPDPTAQADILAAADAEEALALELRGPTGRRIDTERIAIIDTHYLLSIPTNDLELEDCVLSPEEEAEVDAMVEEWREEHPAWAQHVSSDEDVEFPRYQIQVQLMDDNDVP